MNLDQTHEQLQQYKTGLRFAEEQIRTLLKVIPIGLMIIDDQSRVEAANSTAQSIFNCKSEELAGTKINDLIYAPINTKNDFVLEELCKIQQALQFIAKRSNGDPVPVQIQIREFSSSAERKFLVVLEDITQRLEIERLKEDFVGMVTHDLRTPLTSISLFHELVAAGKFDDDLTMLKRRIKRMQRETTRLISMVNGMLDLDKMEAGRLDIIIAPVESKHLIEQSIFSVEALAEHRGIEIKSMRGEGYDTEVLADEKYILQVLVNLLSNSLKFSPSDSTVYIKTEILEGKLIKFMVVDQGPGIREEFRQRMFNRYEQAHISDSRLKGGSGLGLAISKAIVEQHGGTIGVESCEGGSTFWFTIPIKKLDCSVSKNLGVRNSSGATTLNSEILCKMNMHTVSLENVIEKSLECVENLGEDLGISFEAFGTEASVTCDFNGLKQVLVKMLILATECAEKGSTISLDTQEISEGAELCLLFYPQHEFYRIKERQEEEAINCRTVLQTHSGRMSTTINSNQQIALSLILPRKNCHDQSITR